jgi:hypothetical protein
MLAPSRPFRFENDLARRKGEERVVAAYTDVSAGSKARATLPYENVACCNRFATESLDAESFGF